MMGKKKLEGNPNPAAGDHNDTHDNFITEEKPLYEPIDEEKEFHDETEDYI
jgi:hypothetical protein